MSAAAAIVWAWAVAALAMALAWEWQRRRRNAGIVDVVWAAATPAAAAWLAWVAADGDPLRRALVAAIAIAWGVRLSSHLARRFASESEDGRYRRMREALGTRAQPAMFAFFQLQAAWAVMFALPMWAAARAPAPAPSWTDVAGLAVFVVAMAGETLADRQLARFRADPANRGRVCDVGLWRYSRHPNYFFEWLHWFAYPIVGIGSPWWWLAAAGVPVMYVFLTRVTGVPHAERQALESRGDAYRRYQRTTSAFFPRPPSTAGDGA